MIKFFLILVVSFMLTKLISQSIFLAGTPKIQKDFYKKIIAFVFPQNQIKDYAKIAVAQEAEGSRQFVESFNKAENTTKYHYMLSNGKEITIKVPEGIDKPPQKAIEALINKKSKL